MGRNSKGNEKKITNTDKSYKKKSKILKVITTCWKQSTLIHQDFPEDEISIGNTIYQHFFLICMNKWFW